MKKWVTNSLNDRPEPNILLFFLKVMLEFSVLNNFNGLAAFYFGIKKSIDANSKTMKVLLSMTSQDRLIFENAKCLFSEKSNYKKYRENLRSTSLPCLPYVKLLQGDMKQLLKSVIVDGKVDCDRCGDIVSLVEKLCKYQIPYFQFGSIKKDYKWSLIPCIQKWLVTIGENKTIDNGLNEKYFREVSQTIVASLKLKVNESENLPSWVQELEVCNFIKFISDYYLFV
jgi:hypothetical protein